MRRLALILGTIVFAGVLGGFATPAKAGWSVSFGVAYRSGCGYRTPPRHRVHRHYRHYRHHRSYHRPVRRVRHVYRRPHRVIRVHRRSYHHRPYHHRRYVHRRHCR